uniref:Major facilitator superfamily (MFS) profile domain-containing protein n=1 Tax=Mucochytrium quahogii TaxID=96639 RepID=A0A7S2RPU1_9STRA|mmetsp:Transcript_43485/g.69575  ORF Transcript_43485/g.69575 Transcript_43485/m.69575 type:complete len:412 (+) Transcript_43485:988-2223(+)|eukprot:CAMPEP_0203762622 /NCGR_PEP_ID=MMETSP0098-20131031/15465_1 /ASSEMBLY_ACC=CAM_ASM_000208 /TAXON_ID=96639 /ORGANISM=" , Strain NY0313808BC1" /LENGTH=411 /DNA_ID=CAMNT_0050657103 /DNA_START=846 /DNA_END=2081 /DNA_ORIENTATION=-
MLDRVGRFLGGGECKDLNSCVLVHANILVYSLCFWIQQPVLPYLSKELGADAVVFGSLESALSLLALLGGPLLGRLTDEKGAKVALIASHLGSLYMYSLMAGATRLEILFASRLGAFSQHAMLCGQAAITQLTGEATRSSAMGRLSLSYAIGMVFGSPLGGQLASFVGYRGASMLAAVLTFCILCFDVVWLPDFRDGTAKRDERQGGGVKKMFNEALSNKTVLSVLLVTLPVSIGIGSFRSMFSLAGKQTYGLESKDLGMYISFAACTGLVTNVFLIGHITTRFGEWPALCGASFALGACYFSYAFADTYSQLLVLTVPSTMASTLLYTLSSSLMSKAASKGSAGLAISLSHASRSFVGIISPMVGGLVYEYHRFGGLCMFASGCAFATMASVALRKAGKGKDGLGLEKEE